jgi:etoposide-induced 2.4 mRNA
LRYAHVIRAFERTHSWYQEIADVVFSADRKKNSRRPAASKSNLTQRIADEIYRNLLFITTLIQISGFYYLIPYYYIGPIISFLLVSWLYAFYSFDYIWISQHLSLTDRLRYFEERWTYFAGFGMPSALLTFCFPLFIGGGLYALVFPVFILVSSVARPESGPPLVRRLPIFGLSRRLNLWLIQLLRSRLSSSK